VCDKSQRGTITGIRPHVMSSNVSLYIFFPPGVAVTVTRAFIVYVNVS